VKTRTLVLLSGGLDSYGTAAELRAADMLGAALWADYGQRAAGGERNAAELQAAKLDVPLRFTKLDIYTDLPNTGGLIDGELADDADTRRLWVPGRNAVLFSVGAAVAESLGMANVALGLNAEEAADFPDNSTSFLAAADRFLFLATAGRVQAVSPTVHWSKREIVGRLLDLGLPLDPVYSCYRPPDARGRMCGRCPSCRRLREALAVNGIDLSARFAG
jgi:7-cyano-7-deazaguanine synthase